MQSVTVTNGGLATAIALLGSYMATTSVTADWAHGVASLTEAPQTERLSLLSHPLDLMMGATTHRRQFGRHERAYS